MTMPRLIRWGYRLLRTRRTHALEASLALEALVTGLYVLFPGRPSFTEGSLFVLLPDSILGGIMTVHGIGALLALYYGDVHMCRRSALASAALWATIAAGFIFADGAALWFVPVFVVLAASAFWVYLRLHIRYKEPVIL